MTNIDLRPTQTRHEPSLAPPVRELVQQTEELWWTCDDPGLPILPTYTQTGQKAREALMGRFVDALRAERGQPYATDSDRQAARQRLTTAVQRYLSPALGLDDSQTSFIVSHPFPDLGMEFCRQARRFDPGLDLVDVVQASRNAVVMHNIQTLLGRPAELTPSIIGYSLIYPYSDNLLDDPTIPLAGKRGFGARLAARLSGKGPAPVGPQENAIWRLVALIESQYPRGSFPQVYDSLLAIHNAQSRSVRLLERGAAPYEVDVLGISLEKGGTSVLADGYLVAGTLPPAQAAFLFRLGAFLQLGDDLQDIDDNLKDGLLTIFTQTARRWPLDGLTTRILHFGRKVLADVDCFDLPGLEPLKSLMAVATRLLLIEAAGHARRFYTRDYIRELETHSPVRFPYLDRQRRRLGREQTLWASLLETILTPEIQRCAQS